MVVILPDSIFPHDIDDHHHDTDGNDDDDDGDNEKKLFIVSGLVSRRQYLSVDMCLEVFNICTESSAFTSY